MQPVHTSDCKNDCARGCRVVVAWLPIEKNKVTQEETKTRDRTEAATSRTEADPLQPMINRNQSLFNCELDRDPI